MEGQSERRPAMKIFRRLFILAAIAGIVAVAARKLGLIGEREDDSFDFVFEDSADDDSADDGDDDASE